MWWGDGYGDFGMEVKMGCYYDLCLGWVMVLCGFVVVCMEMMKVGFFWFLLFRYCLFSVVW